jgi:hypothetical protein
MTDEQVGLLSKQAYWDGPDMASMFSELARARSVEQGQATEIERLKADAAALFRDLREAHSTMAESWPTRPIVKILSATLSEPHPGAALLKAKAQQAETIKALADALENLLPPERAPGCWCHHSRAVETAGHAPPCSITRAALRLTGRLP